MKEHQELLKEAVSEIKWLRNQNELLAAKLEGVEMMAMAVTSEQHRGPSAPMKECMVYKIERYFLSQEAAK